MDPEILQCSVCLHGYNSTTQRPFDLGCGHSFCEQCIKASPRSFRHCPECRARASNPHANIALLRLLDALDGNGQAATSAAADSSGHSTSQQQQQQQQPRQRQHQQPVPAFGAGGVFRNPPGAGSEPLGTLGTMLNQVAAAMPATGSSGGSNVANAGNSVMALPGSLAEHKANIAQLRTSMWVYLTPLMGMLYILSPLDLIPDFLPLVGWVDDALVLFYVVCSVFQVLRARGNASASRT